MADQAENELQPGSVLGNYVLEELVGGGAMGVVWRGSDRRDGSAVAVKILNQQFSRDPTFRQRFEREAHVATLLKSPYTVQTFAFGREQGLYYLVMEFVEGDSVEKKLARGPLPLDEAMEIATDAARALEAAASHKIVHRDLKPSNIIVSPDGAAKLVDFGIAGQANVQDAGGHFIGTVQYAPPEQQGGQVSERTDIYALGATLFHMLAGRPPYTGRTNDDILAQHKMAPFPAPLLALQPEAVVDVIRRCMQKDPEDRYASASDLAAALDRVRMRIVQVRAQTAPVLSDDLRTLVPQPEPAEATGDTLVLPGKPAAAAPLSPPTGSDTVMHPSAASAPPPAPPVAPRPASAPPAAPPPATPPPAAAAPTPSPTPAAATAVAAPAAAGGGGGKKGRGMLFALLGGGFLAVAIAIGAVFALSGGGDDDGKVPASTSPSPVSSPSPSASSSPSATVSAGASSTSATSTASSAATTAAPTATPVPPTPTTVPPTATPTTSQPTPTTAPPTPTPPPAQASYSFGGFTGSCAGDGAILNFSNVNTPTTITGRYTGPTAFDVAPVSIGPGIATAGQVTFPTVSPLTPGTYSFTAFANGTAVASGSVNITC